MSDKPKKQKSYGKEFERQVFKDFSRVNGVSIDRIPDQVTRYKNSSSNICDFIIFKYDQFSYSRLIYLECKSTHGASLPIYSEPKADKKGELHGFYGNIRDNQWEGLVTKSKIPGVRAGVLIWFIDKDVTMYVPIEVLQKLREDGHKSIRFDDNTKAFVHLNNANVSKHITAIRIDGKKKRTMFEYDFSQFFIEV